MNDLLESAYNDWKQISGYFDADGNAAYDPGRWVLFPRLSFLDNFRPQITMVQRFLVSQELHVWENNQAHGGAWRIGIARAESVYKAATMMRPYLHKKREEIVAIIDYLDSRITATQMVEVFNESVRKGNRTGKINPVDIPYTRKEGKLLRRAEMIENIASSKAKNAIMAAGIAEMVREIVFSNEMAEEEVVKRLDTSTATLTRRLRRGSIQGG
jgi:hypothetical protein